MRKRIVTTGLIVLALFVTATGVLAPINKSEITQPVVNAHCGPCPLYCIGVTCDNGRTYCNSCLAACAGAHNCVVTGF